MRVALLALLLGTSCRYHADFACGADDQCTRGQEPGVCEPEGWCSFVDGLCPSGRRFDELAGGGLAGQCVGAGAGDAPAGGDGAPRDAPDGAGGGCVVDEIVAGDAHTCVILSSRRVACWGDNLENRLTSALPNPQRVPELLPSPTSIGELALRAGHSCAVGNDLWCWGSGSEGQLGNGSTAPSGAPDSIGFEEAESPAVGDGHTCLSPHEGAVMCWGRNVEGQVGDGSNLQRTTPVTVQLATGGSLGSVSGVVAGRRHSCAWRSGSAWCWGDNAKGQLGDGTMTPHPSAVPVTGLAGVSRMAAGKDFTCALASGGSVYCWGENNAGQTGDGSAATPRLLAGQVMGLPGPASAISAGERHACALVGDELWCWGSSGDGQLGEGVSGDQTAAHHVEGLAGVDRIAAGGRHTCVRLGAAGELRCFGANASGQLGNGGSTATPVPQDVSVPCP